MTTPLDSVLRDFAGLLHWKGLQRYDHAIEGDARNKIAWYETGDMDDLLFQINTCPCFCAAVFAIPYSICSGWYQFKPHENHLALRSEAERLTPLLDRRNFDAPGARAAFRATHPECAGYSMAKLRNHGAPIAPESFGEEQRPGPDV